MATVARFGLIHLIFNDASNYAAIQMGCKFSPQRSFWCSSQQRAEKQSRWKRKKHAINFVNNTVCAALAFPKLIKYSTNAFCCSTADKHVRKICKEKKRELIHKLQQQRKMYRKFSQISNEQQFMRLKYLQMLHSSAQSVFFILLLQISSFSLEILNATHTQTLELF